MDVFSDEFISICGFTQNSNIFEIVEFYTVSVKLVKDGDVVGLYKYFRYESWVL